MTGKVFVRKIKELLMRLDLRCTQCRETMIPVVGFTMRSDGDTLQAIITFDCKCGLHRGLQHDLESKALKFANDGFDYIVSELATLVEGINANTRVKNKLNEMTAAKAAVETASDAEAIAVVERHIAETLDYYMQQNSAQTTSDATLTVQDSAHMGLPASQEEIAAPVTNA